MIRRCFVIPLLLGTILSAGIKEDFFTVGYSAKSMAIGGTALSFGVDSLYTNPAGLAVIPEEYYTFSYKTSFENMISTTILNYMQPHERGAWGIGLIMMDNLNADKTEIDEFDRPNVVGHFGERQLGISLAYALPFGNEEVLGFGGRYYRNQLDTEQGQALGFYAGYIKQLRFDWLYGIALNNLSLSNHPLNTPIVWSTGHTDYFATRLSQTLAHRRYLWSYLSEFFVDWHITQVNENGRSVSTFSCGSQIWIVPKLFAARGGINDETLSLGMGLRLADWGLDYSYLNHQYLGGSHYITVSWHPGAMEK